MKKVSAIFLSVFFLLVFYTTGSFSSVQPEEPDKATKLKLIDPFGKLPLSFIENMGQINSKVSYCLKVRKVTIYFTREGIVYNPGISKASSFFKKQSLKTSSIGDYWVLIRVVELL